MSSFCAKCGSTLPPNSVFCTQCGTGQARPNTDSRHPPRPTQPLDPAIHPQPHTWMHNQPDPAPMRVQPAPHSHPQQRQQTASPYKQCPFCRETIQAEAIKCRFCGEIVDVTRRNFGQQQQPAVNQTVNVGVPLHPYGYMPPVKLWSPGLAAFLSFLIPGLGQIYKGQVGIGIIWFIAVLVGYGVFVVPGLILHIICIATAASGDPYRR